MAEETQYSKTLYDQLNTIDPTYGDDVSFEKFQESIKDKGYADQVYKQLNSLDPTYSKDVPFTKFYNSVNPPAPPNVFQKAWGNFTSMFDKPLDSPTSFTTKGSASAAPSSFLDKIGDNIESGHGIFGASPEELAADAKWKKEQQKVLTSRGDVQKNMDEIEKGITSPTKFSDKPQKDMLPENLMKASLAGTGAVISTIPNSKKGEPDIVNVDTKNSYEPNEVNKIAQETYGLLGKLGYARQGDGSFKKIGPSSINPDEYESYVSSIKNNIAVTKNKMLEQDAEAQSKINVASAMERYGSGAHSLLIGKLFGQTNSDKASDAAKNLDKLDTDLTASIQNQKAEERTSPIQDVQSKAFLREDYIDPKSKQIDYQAWNGGIDENIKTSQEFRNKLASSKKEFQNFGIDMTYAGDPKNKALIMQKFNYANPDKSFKNWLSSVSKGETNLTGAAGDNILGTIGGTIDFLTNGEMSSLDKEAMYIAGVTPYKQQFEASGKQLKDQIKANEDQINKIVEQQSNIKPGYVVSPEGKKQLQDLQDTNQHLHDALDENEQTVTAINKSIIDNTKNLTKQEATTKWMEDKYNTAGILKNVPILGQFKYGQGAEATGYFLRGVTSIPGNVGDLLKNLGAVSTGNTFKASTVLPSQNAIYDYTPQALTQSISNTVKYDPKNGISWDGVGLWYSTLKTGAESFMLGEGGGGAEGLGAKYVGEVGAEKAFDFEVANTYNTLASQYRQQGLAHIAHGLEWAAKEGATWGIEGAVGYVAPSVLMFGNDMIKAEMQKGLTLEEATKIGMMRAAIEGLTEKLNPLEMDIIKGRFLNKEVENIGEDLMFKELLRDKLGLSAKTFDFLYGVGQFATKGTKQGLYETIEEEVGLWMNDKLTRDIQKDHPAYVNDEPFNGQNIINTALTTMATMAPMSFYHGATEARYNMQSLRYSRFVVGSNPSLYVPTIAQQLQAGKITQEQALKSLQIIGNLNNAFLQAKPDIEHISKATNLSGEEQKEKQTEIFNKHLALLDKSGELEAMLPEVREAKLEELERINDQIKEIRESAKIEVSKAQDEENKVFANEELVTAEIDEHYRPDKVLNTTDVNILSTNLDHVNKELETLMNMKESEQHDGIIESYSVAKNNLETRLRGIKENKEVRLIDGKYLKMDLLKPSTEGEITADDVQEVNNVSMPVAQKMADLGDLIKDRGFSVFSKGGVFGLTDPEGNVVHQEPTIEALESYVKLLDLTPQSTVEMQIAENKQYSVGETVELSPTITQTTETTTPEEIQEEEVPAEEVPQEYPDGSTEKEAVKLNSIPDNVYIESTEAQVAKNNKSDITQLGTVQGSTRIDGNIVYDGDKLVYVPTLAAYEARTKHEETYQGADGETHQRIVDDSNQLNENYARLHSNEIKPGLEVIIRVKDIEQSRFVKESRDRFKETISERQKIGKISNEEQQADLDEDDNFRELEVYDKEGNFLFNIHTIAYIRPSRVALATEDDENNLNTQYQATKAFRQAIIDLHNNLKEQGLPTDISTTISGKATGKLSVDMNNEYSLIGRQFSNREVLESISVAPTARVLSFRGNQSANVQPAGSIAVLIPTPNGQHFALQLSPQKLNEPIIESIITAIKLTVEYRSLLTTLNRTKDQQDKLRSLEAIIDRASTETGFRLHTVDGLKKYISSFTHVNAQSSQFLQGAESRNMENIPFIDFDEKQEKITFSRGRNFKVAADLAETEGTPTEDQAPLKQAQYKSIGVYRTSMFIINKAGNKVSNPGLNEFLDSFKEYLRGRRFNFDKEMQDKTGKFNLPIFNTIGTGSAARYNLMTSQEKTRAGITSEFNNYKDFIRSNVTTNVLEHKLEDKEGKTEYVYFEQPNISLSPVIQQATDAQKIEALKTIKAGIEELQKQAEDVKAKIDQGISNLSGEYKGLKIVQDENLKSSTGEPGGAKFNRNTKEITINKPSLQQKFEEKAWTKPRTQKDGSQATALPEDTFTTYQDWENFVMEHEFQHSVVSRQEFDALPENDGKQTTIGEYETFINNAALAQLSESTKTSDQTETSEEIRKSEKEDLSSQKEDDVDDDWASLAPIRNQQIPIDINVEFGDLTKQVENKCK